MGRRDPRLRAGIPPTFGEVTCPPALGGRACWGCGPSGASGPREASRQPHQHRLPLRAPTLGAPTPRRCRASAGVAAWGTRQAQGAAQSRPEPEGSTRSVWPAVALGTCSVPLLALKHSKITFASHFQKIATVKTEGSQPQGGDPATRPAPPEAAGDGGRGRTLRLPGPQETISGPGRQGALLRTCVTQGPSRRPPAGSG